jgi:hypothetical protein
MLKKLQSLVRFLRESPPDRPAGALGIVYDQGVKSAARGEPNPYPEGTDRHKAWQHGFELGNTAENSIW